MIIISCRAYQRRTNILHINIIYTYSFKISYKYSYYNSLNAKFDTKFKNLRRKFVFGVLSVLCYPFIATAIRSIATPASAAAQFMSDYGSTVIWSAISLMAVILTYSAYDITLSLSRQPIPHPLRAK